MITLDIPPNKQAIIEQASRRAGMSIEQYIISKVLSDEQPPRQHSVRQRKLGFMKGEIKIPDDIHWGDEAVLVDFDEYL